MRTDRPLGDLHAGPGERVNTAETGALPPPDAAAAAHSRRLVDRILGEIADAGGAIPFARFVELALYEPGLG